MKVFEVHGIDLIMMNPFDKYAISRLLIANGFKYTGGPLMPKLSGTITMEFDKKSYLYKFKQISITDEVNDNEYKT